MNKPKVKTNNSIKVFAEVNGNIHAVRVPCRPGTSTRTLQARAMRELRKRL